jgi:hypothetical protein
MFYPSCYVILAILGSYSKPESVMQKAIVRTIRTLPMPSMRAAALWS